MNYQVRMILLCLRTVGADGFPSKPKRGVRLQILYCVVILVGMCLAGGIGAGVWKEMRDWRVCTVVAHLRAGLQPHQTSWSFFAVYFFGGARGGVQNILYLPSDDNYTPAEEGFIRVWTYFIILQVIARQRRAGWGTTPPLLPPVPTTMPIAFSHVFR